MTNLADKFNSWWEKTFSTFESTDWLILVPVFALTYFTLMVFHRSIKSLVHKSAKNRPRIVFIDKFLSTAHWPFFTAASIYISLLVSPIPYEYKSTFNKIFGLAIILQVGIWLNTSAKFLFSEVLSKETDASRTTVLRAISVLTRLILWTGILLLILDNFGVNITTLVAGLGIGGIAIALGVQKIMGDIFASLSIVMDRPFVIGDYIVIGEFRGHVEDIGIKTTRIRSLSGERIIFSNSDLLESRIQNFTQMFRRRVELNIGVTYETSIENIKLAKKLIEDVINSLDIARFDSAKFKTFGDSALIIEVVYWINDPSGEAHADTRDKIGLGIIDAFNKNKIEFAYPTQRLIIDKNITH